MTIGSECENISRNVVLASLGADNPALEWKTRVIVKDMPSKSPAPAMRTAPLTWLILPIRRRLRVPQNFVYRFSRIWRGRHRDNNAFAGGSITSIGRAVDGNEDVSFGKIRRCATACDVERRDHEVPRRPFFTLVMTRQVDKLSLFKAGGLNVFRIDKKDSAAVIDTAIAIVQAIYGSVKLIVAANCRQKIFSGLQAVRG